MTVIGPPALDYRQAIETWQAEIDDRDVIFLGVTAEPRIFAVANQIDDESCLFESPQDQ